jgi:hypothetical protein
MNWTPVFHRIRLRLYLLYTQYERFVHLHKITEKQKDAWRGGGLHVNTNMVTFISAPRRFLIKELFKETVQPD